MDGAGVVVVLGVLILIIVAVIAYRVGYLRAQDVSHRLEAEWRRLPMEAPLPRWRRAAGWAAYVSSALSLCLFLVVAYVYAYRWGWTYLTAAWILWFGIFLGVLWLAEWCWKPSREAQGGASDEKDPE